jgi:hypothetical protein
MDTTPVTTLTGGRLPGPSGFLPPSQHSSWRDQSKPPAPRNRQSSDVINDATTSIRNSCSRRGAASGGNRKDHPGFAGETLQEQDTFYPMPFHLTYHVIA